MSKPPLHVAHILPWSSVGGTELATLRLAEAVGNDNFSHTIFCKEVGTPVEAMFQQAGFITAPYQAIEPSYRHPTNFISTSLTLAKELKRREIDLVHCADLLAGYYAAIAGKLARLPVLCHVRCSYPNVSRRDKTFLKAIDHFAFVSNDAWKTFDVEVPGQRGTVIYDGLDLFTENGEDRSSARAEFNIPESTVVIGMVSRVAPAKDFDTLIRAAELILKASSMGRTVHFLIVGDHSQVDLNRAHYSHVQQLLNASGLSPHFTFTDHREDVQRLLAAMDIFLLSTRTEGLPLVILEAMAQGKPVVATAVGGVPEIVQHGQTGFLHEPGNYQEQAAQLTSLIEDANLRRQFGAAGQARVRSNFSKETFAASVSELYQRLVRGRVSSSKIAQKVA